MKLIFWGTLAVAAAIFLVWEILVAIGVIQTQEPIPPFIESDSINIFCDSTNDKIPASLSIDDYKKGAKDTLKLNSIINEHSVGGVMQLGESVRIVLNRLVDMGYKYTTIPMGELSSDNAFVVKKGNKPVFTLIQNAKGLLDTIIVFSPEFKTTDGISVGLRFSDFFAKHPKSDMRFGDLYDCVNDESGTEMAKANGMLFIHHLNYDSPLRIADYDFDKMSFKKRSPMPNPKIEGIVVTLSTWE